MDQWKEDYALTVLSILFLFIPSFAIDINSCTLINSPGEYHIVADIVANASPCINITSQNVSLYGDGFIINLNGSRIGVFVSNPTPNGYINITNITLTNSTNASYGFLFSNVSNVNAWNLTTVNSTYPLYINASTNISIDRLNVIGSMNRSNITITRSRNTVINDMDVYQLTTSGDGISYALSIISSNNTLINSSSLNGTRLIYLDASYNTTINNTRITHYNSNNWRYAVYIQGNTNNLIIDNLDFYSYQLTTTSTSGLYATSSSNIAILNSAFYSSNYTTIPFTTLNFDSYLSNIFLNNVSITSGNGTSINVVEASNVFINNTTINVNGAADSSSNEDSFINPYYPVLSFSSPFNDRENISINNTNIYINAFRKVIIRYGPFSSSSGLNRIANFIVENTYFYKPPNLYPAEVFHIRFPDISNQKRCPVFINSSSNNGPILSIVNKSNISINDSVFEQVILCFSYNISLNNLTMINGSGIDIIKSTTSIDNNHIINPAKTFALNSRSFSYFSPLSDYLYLTNSYIEDYHDFGIRNVLYQRMRLEFKLENVTINSTNIRVHGRGFNIDTLANNSSLVFNNVTVFNSNLTLIENGVSVSSNYGFLYINITNSTFLNSTGSIFTDETGVERTIWFIENVNATTNLSSRFMDIYSAKNIEIINSYFRRHRINCEGVRSSFVNIQNSSFRVGDVYFGFTGPLPSTFNVENSFFETSDAYFTGDSAKLVGSVKNNNFVNNDVRIYSYSSNVSEIGLLINNTFNNSSFRLSGISPYYGYFLVFGNYFYGAPSARIDSHSSNNSFITVVENNTFDSFAGPIDVGGWLTIQENVFNRTSLQQGGASYGLSIIGNAFVSNSSELDASIRIYSSPKNTTIYNNTFDGLNKKSCAIKLEDQPTDLNISLNNITKWKKGGICITSANVKGIIYNNAFLYNSKSVNVSLNIPNLFWNITNTSGTNIVGGPIIGGNFYSENLGCVDANIDGICDNPYNHSAGANWDYLPLSYSLSTVWLVYEAEDVLETHPGMSYIYNTTLYNFGNETAFNVTPSIQCPINWICQALNATIDNVTPMQGVNVSFNISPYLYEYASSKVVYLIANASNENTTKANNSLLFYLLQPNVSVVSPPLVNVSENVTSTVEILLNNTGNGNAFNLSLTHNCPAQWACTFNESLIANLPNNSYRNISLNITVPYNWSTVNTTVTIKASDWHLKNSTNTTLVHMLSPYIYWEIYSPTIDSGANNSFEVNVTNRGDAPANASLSISCYSSWLCSLNETIASLNPGEKKTITVYAWVPLFETASQRSATYTAVDYRNRWTWSKTGTIYLDLGMSWNTTNVSANLTVPSYSIQQISNTGANPKTIAVSIEDCPAGWTCAFNESSFTLNPGQKKDLNLTIIVPYSETRYEAKIKAVANDSVKISKSDITIFIRQPSFAWQTEPQTLFRGQWNSFTENLTNNGSIAWEVNISVICPAGWTCNLNISSVLLNPGANESINVSAYIPLDYNFQSANITLIANDSVRAFLKNVSASVKGAYFNFTIEKKNLTRLNSTVLLLNVTNIGDAPSTAVTVGAVCYDATCILNQTSIPSLAAGEKTTLEINITPSLNVSSTPYYFNLTANSSESARNQQLSLTVQLPTLAITAPSYVYTPIGSGSAFNITISNKGRDTAYYVVSNVTCKPTWVCYINGTQYFNLSANDSANLTLYVMPPLDETQNGTANITVLEYSPRINDTESVQIRIYVPPVLTEVPVDYLLEPRINFAGALDIATGDFDGNGYVDFVLVRNDTSLIYSTSYFRNFTNTANLSTTGACSGASGDFNRDLYQDIAIGYENGSVLVYTNDGFGSFSYAYGTTRPLPSCALASGDFNKDGYIDLVVANGNDLYILINSGSSLSFGGLVATLPSPRGLTAGDYDNDGNIDIAAGDYGGQLNIIANNGSMGFNVTSTYMNLHSNAKLYGLCTGDMELNMSALDIVSGDFIGEIEYFRNREGVFSQQVVKNIGEGINALSCADLDRDGDIDILYSTDSISQPIFSQSSINKTKGSSTYPNYIQVSIKVKYPYYREGRSFTITDTWIEGEVIPSTVADARIVDANGIERLIPSGRISYNETSIVFSDVLNETTTPYIGKNQYFTVKYRVQYNLSYQSILVPIVEYDRDAPFTYPVSEFLSDDVNNFASSPNVINPLPSVPRAKDIGIVQEFLPDIVPLNIAVYDGSRETNIVNDPYYTHPSSPRSILLEYGVSATPDLAQGENLTILLYVTNIGTGASAANATLLINETYFASCMVEVVANQTSMCNISKEYTWWNPLKGDYNLTLVVDPDGTLPEANKSNNNLSTTFTVLEGADPSIISLDLLDFSNSSATEVYEDTLVRFNVVLANFLSHNASVFLALRWNESGNSSDFKYLDEGDDYCYQQPRPKRVFLNGNSTSSYLLGNSNTLPCRENLAYDFIAPRQYGSSTDLEGSVEIYTYYESYPMDSKKTNNDIATDKIKVKPTPPDYSVCSVVKTSPTFPYTLSTTTNPGCMKNILNSPSYNPVTLLPNGTFLLNITVYNIGGMPGTTTVRFWWDNGTLLGTPQVINVDPHDTVQVIQMVDMAGSNSTRVIKMEVVPEPGEISNSTNNGTITLEIGNLEVEMSPLTNALISQSGEKEWVTAKVKNTGGMPTAPTTIQFSVNGDVKHTLSVPALNPDESIRYQVDVDVPGDVARSNVSVSVDPSNIIPEISEGDNNATLPVCNLDVTLEVTMPPNLEAGRTNQINVKMRNNNNYRVETEFCQASLRGLKVDIYDGDVLVHSLIAREGADNSSSGNWLQLIANEEKNFTFFVYVPDGLNGTYTYNASVLSTYKPYGGHLWLAGNETKAQYIYITPDVSAVEIEPNGFATFVDGVNVYSNDGNLEHNNRQRMDSYFSTGIRKVNYITEDTGTPVVYVSRKIETSGVVNVVSPLSPPIEVQLLTTSLREGYLEIVNVSVTNNDISPITLSSIVLEVYNATGKVSDLYIENEYSSLVISPLSTKVVSMQVYVPEGLNNYTVKAKAYRQVRIPVVSYWHNHYFGTSINDSQAANSSYSDWIPYRLELYSGPYKGAFYGRTTWAGSSWQEVIDTSMDFSGQCEVFTDGVFRGREPGIIGKNITFKCTSQNGDYPQPSYLRVFEVFNATSSATITSPNQSAYSLSAEMPSGGPYSGAWNDVRLTVTNNQNSNLTFNTVHIYLVNSSNTSQFVADIYGESGLVFEPGTSSKLLHFYIPDTVPSDTLLKLRAVTPIVIYTGFHQYSFGARKYANNSTLFDERWPGDWSRQGALGSFKLYSPVATLGKAYLYHTLSYEETGVVSLYVNGVLVGRYGGEKDGYYSTSAWSNYFPFNIPEGVSQINAEISGTTWGPFPTDLSKVVKLEIERPYEQEFGEVVLNQQLSIGAEASVSARKAYYANISLNLTNTLNTTMSIYAIEIYGATNSSNTSVLLYSEIFDDMEVEPLSTYSFNRLIYIPYTLSANALYIRVINRYYSPILWRTAPAANFDINTAKYASFDDSDWPVMPHTISAIMKQKVYLPSKLIAMDLYPRGAEEVWYDQFNSPLQVISKYVSSADKNYWYTIKGTSLVKASPLYLSYKSLPSLATGYGVRAAYYYSVDSLVPLYLSTSNYPVRGLYEVEENVSAGQTYMLTVNLINDLPFPSDIQVLASLDDKQNNRTETLYAASYLVPPSSSTLAMFNATIPTSRVYYSGAESTSSGTKMELVTCNGIMDMNTTYNVRLSSTTESITPDGDYVIFYMDGVQSLSSFTADWYIDSQYLLTSSDSNSSFTWKNGDVKLIFIACEKYNGTVSGRYLLEIPSSMLSAGVHKINITATNPGWIALAKGSCPTGVVCGQRLDTSSNIALIPVVYRLGSDAQGAHESITKRALVSEDIGKNPAIPTTDWVVENPAGVLVPGSGAPIAPPYIYRKEIFPDSFLRDMFAVRTSSLWVNGQKVSSASIFTDLSIGSSNSIAYSTDSNSPEFLLFHQFNVPMTKANLALYDYILYCIPHQLYSPAGGSVVGDCYLNNTGNRNLNVTVSTNTSWAVPNQTFFESLAPGESRQFLVNYTPPFINDWANITIMGDEPNAGLRNDSVIVIVNVSLNYTLYCDPHVLYAEPYGSVSGQCFLTALGEVPLNITVSTDTSWAVPNQTYFPSLAPGETRPFMVNYTPPFTNGTA
ncbi:MAG: CARDB domain-containing protein, partial [Candidatus Anstonellales archaeon]